MSDMSKVEQGTVGRINLDYGDKPTIEPKKITEQDIQRAVTEVIKEGQEQRLSPTASTIVESANATTLSRLKNLPEKARHALRLSVKKAALTAYGLYIIVSSACGNMENPSITPTEPTPGAAAISKPPMTESPELKSEERKFAEKIKGEYGMDIEFEFSSYYDTPLSDIPERLHERYIFGPKPKEHVTEAELKVLQEAISTLPFCAKINGRLLIIKDPGVRNPGAETGNKYFIGTTQAKTPRNEMLILLSIRENAPLDGSNLEPHVSGINTNAEQLKHVYYHECGHALAFTVLEAAFPDQFFDITDPSKIEVAYKDEQKNPLYIAFSKLEGWRLREDIFKTAIPDAPVYVKDTPDSRMVLGYTNLKIAEHFAELFGLYISNSPVLTNEERMFFGKIKRGFEINPKESAKQIAQDPMMLLRSE